MSTRETKHVASTYVCIYIIYTCTWPLSWGGWPAVLFVGQILQNKHVANLGKNENQWNVYNTSIQKNQLKTLIDAMPWCLKLDVSHCIIALFGTWHTYCFAVWLFWCKRILSLQITCVTKHNFNMPRANTAQHMKSQTNAGSEHVLYQKSLFGTKQKRRLECIAVYSKDS